MNAKVKAHSPDGEQSQKSKSKGKKKKAGPTSLTGIDSINGSNIDETPVILINQSMDRSGTAGMSFNKVKPRDFDIQSNMLKKLGATKYDQFDDINMLKLRLEEVVKEQMVTWKTVDMDKIKYLIKLCVISELNRIEERKYVRREQKVIE